MNLQENILRIKQVMGLIMESDPKVGTGKKPEGSGRRLYTDENPNDTVSVKFRTKEDIVDTLNKESFKSKSHKRQSQIINLIHQRVRAAYQNAKDPETKQRLKRAYDYIEGEKERSKKKTIRLQKQNESELTEKGWGNSTEKLSREFKFKDFKESMNFVNKVAKIAEAQNHHPDLEIKYDNVRVTISDHDEGGVSQKCYKFIESVDKLKQNKTETNQSELTEKCWPGYTQKGMKTMFGKRYPNCVKKTKK